MSFFQETLVILFVMSLFGALFTSGVRRLRLFAHPNERSSHKVAIPSSGGLAIMATYVLTLVVLQLRLTPFMNAAMIWLVAGAVVVGLIGFCDDRFDLSPKLRLVLTFIMSTLLFTFVLHNVAYWSPWFYALILLNLGFTNAYNFYDGLNGLAAMTLLMVLPFAALIFPENALLLLALVPALVGFLVWNLRGKIFMGDTGSLFLGFLFPLLVLFGRSEHVLLIILILGHLLFPMLADISLTVLRRLMARQSVLKPHRDFYFLRLHDKGIPHAIITAGYALAVLLQGTLSLLVNLRNPYELGGIYVFNVIFYGILLKVIHTKTTKSLKTF